MLSKLYMYNLFTRISGGDAVQFRQLSCGESLITIFNCPLENKFQDTWSHHNYIVYVIQGRKIWHTPNGSYDLQPPQCVFIRKGACIIEQFFDAKFCLILFFIPDDFIVDVLKSKTNPIGNPRQNHQSVIPVNHSPATQAFFQSMMPYFEQGHNPDQSLLQLKFKELILSIADNPENKELLSYFSLLLQEPQNVSLQRIMDENFSFNLKLEDYAKLSCRSVSAFKRDFVKIYNTSPGKWLLARRLEYGMHLLRTMGKSVSDVAFESGFESPSHFSRSFRDRFGISPAAIRQKVLS
ncbi:MAG: helix-turn-helix transcriptional regulator [Chitinophagaceae bacterium]|nr:helix-turn-helix transcriptional regulator [Chitinophagaceae bacterium]